MDCSASCQIFFNDKFVIRVDWPFNIGEPPSIGKVLVVLSRDHIPTTGKAILAFVLKIQNGDWTTISDDYVTVDIENEGEYRFSFFHSSLTQKVPINTVLVWDAVQRENSALMRWSTENDHVILLLGESGIGKTTFVNNVVNLLRYQSLEEAVSLDDLFILAPSVTTTEDAEGNPITVSIGRPSDDPNEVLVAGQAATQQPQLHVFCHENKIYKLIDVPGTLDNRGTDQDKENMKRTLDCLLTFKRIHAICILFKPNENRLGVSLKYNINLLLSHLHKSSANNIFFCFTNSRQVHFRGGMFITILRDYLNLIKERNGVDISMERERLFYFDNEALISWALKKHGLLEKSEYGQYKRSWDESKKSLNRLLEKVASVEPYYVTGLESISVARKTMLEMIPLLGEITSHIYQNKRLTDEADARIGGSANKQLDLTQHKTIKQLTLKKEDLPYPRTVCVNRKCVTFTPIGSTHEFRTHYNKLCHHHCYLRNIAVEKYPLEGLKFCTAFNCGKTTSCTNCGCAWSFHKHIRYEAVLGEEEIPNESVMSKLYEGITSGTKRDVLLGYTARTEKLQKDLKAVNRVCVRFANFLKANAIVAYNDAFDSYLDYLIAQAQEKAFSTGDNREAQQLKEHKALYEKEVAIFQQAVVQGTQDSLGLRELSVATHEIADLEIVGPIFCRFWSIPERDIPQAFNNLMSKIR